MNKTQLEHLTVLARQQPVFDHPFLRAFAKGAFGKEATREMLTAFGHHVRVFTSVLGHLVGAAPTVEARALLLHNLDEELGYGDAAKSHFSLYSKMLRSIDALSVESTEPLESISVLNSALTHAVSTSFVHGLAWLGLGGELTIPNNFPYLKAGLLFYFPDADTEFCNHHGAVDEDHSDDANYLLMQAAETDCSVYETVRAEMLKSLWIRGQVWGQMKDMA